MIDLNTGEAYSPVLTVIMLVVIVVALGIALNMRKKIEKNEDRGGLLFTPEKLRIVSDDDGEAGSGDDAAGIDGEAELGAFDGAAELESNDSDSDGREMSEAETGSAPGEAEYEEEDDDGKYDNDLSDDAK